MCCVFDRLPPRLDLPLNNTSPAPLMSPSPPPCHLLFVLSSTCFFPAESSSPSQPASLSGQHIHKHSYPSVNFCTELVLSWRVCTAYTAGEKDGGRAAAAVKNNSAFQRKSIVKYYDEIIVPRLSPSPSSPSPYSYLIIDAKKMHKPTLIDRKVMLWINLVKDTNFKHTYVYIWLELVISPALRVQVCPYWVSWGWH